jgi:hypothetical protein
MFEDLKMGWGTVETNPQVQIAFGNVEPSNLYTPIIGDG